MKYTRKAGGFSLIELLVVLSVSSIVILMGASYFSGNIALRRSVDEITNSIGSTLNLTKIKSTRNGVQYRLVFADCTSVNDTDPECEICNTYENFTSGDGEISLIMERGDSNIGSTVWCMQDTQRKNLMSTKSDIGMSANLANAPINISFSPTGMRSDFRTDATEETITIFPVSGTVDKCGVVGVSSTGALRVIQGRWDGTACQAILDAQPTPGP